MFRPTLKNLRPLLRANYSTCVRSGAAQFRQNSQPLTYASNPKLFSRILFSTNNVVDSEPIDAEVVDEAEVDEKVDLDEAAASTLKNEETITGTTKEHTFQAHTRQILDIVANSLYTDKEVFLRELISNASDALEKCRYVQSTGEGVINDDLPMEVRIYLDELNNTLTIVDTGIGMNAEELVNNLGTIARSGSKAFLQEMDTKEDPAGATNNIIGQFGVGFYSTFMVGTDVTVYSQSADGSTPNCWKSDGNGSYSLTEAANVQRGTKIVINLRDNAKEFASKNRIETIIKKYSNFVGFDIYLNDKRLNAVGALWAMDKKSISEEQHLEFYRYVANAYDSPFYRLHFSADAPISISALFYFPERHMEKYGMGRQEPGVSLYSRKVLIQPKCTTILPEWLRFVKGVVDSEDIPLNISRENMQDSALISRLNNVLTKRIIKFLDTQAKKEPDAYKKFFNEFSQFIKEGACTDFQNKTQIAKLLRFDSSASDAGENLCSLDDYISRMPADQNDIFYLVAPNRASARASPYFESFQDKGTEVLFCYQGIDDFVMKNLTEYNKRKLVSVEAAIVPSKEETKDKPKEEVEYEKEIVAMFKSTLGERVSDVVVTHRLKSSPAIVVDHETAAVRKMMKFVNQEGGLSGADQPLPKQKLEINPTHPVLKNIFAAKTLKPDVANLVIEQVFDGALIAADILDNPRNMLPRINKILEESLK